MDKKITPVYCIPRLLLVLIGHCLLVVVSCVASSCRSLDLSPPVDPLALDRPEPNSSPMVDAAALHQECSQASVFLYSDMGVSSGYSPPERIRHVVARIAAQPDLQDLLDAEFERLRHSRRLEIAASALFPLIDLCLWIELRRGASTATMRAELWQLWREKFELEMATKYRATLSFYEAEIRSSKLALVNQ